MSFKRINNITGWSVCIIACMVYLLTMEATGSFWDCGEFASSCWKLQIPHPPGAPLFVLIGRIFMLPFDGKHAATGVNTMSALASGFTILFLFWSITHFARKIVQRNSETLTGNQMFNIMAAGVVGAMAYAFTDSFWYSAVESEVYAMSSFFTAIVFWAALKWEHEVTEEQRAGVKGRFTRADRWLILIFYLIGLSVGVHLLSLLTVPSIIMIYYFKRYTVTRRKTVFAFIVACIVTGIVQVPVIQWSIKLAGQFDIFFKNDMGMPFFFGFGFFFVLMGVIIFFAIRIAQRRNWNFLKLAMWAFAFILLGFSTYYTTLIRSNADPAVDMFNVDNPVSLVGYLSREQYGDWPILYGQDFTAEVADQKAIDTYVKGKDKYEKTGRRYEFVYAPEDKHFFPRMWDASNDQGHADFYASFAGIGKDPKTGKYLDKPTMSDNIGFFLKYQTNFMYWRYFMWNFAGKQNDIQGVDPGNVRDGNWLTGISFFDNLRLGDQSKIPDSIKHNKAHNTLFMLPFILGILGLVYQFMKDKRDGLVVGLLFFFTGFAVIIYLNAAGNQPRERDYAYVGSFYAFAVWIGIGVLYVKELFNRFIKNTNMASYAAAAVCLLGVPVLMGAQEWNDHDRSHKVLARDLAIDYLESCAPNAILVTFGDNDTYPLWYAQEVENVRRDVRVINSSLLGTDWYINQLRYKVNQSDPIDLVWTPDQILGSKRDAIYYDPQLPGVNVDQNQYMDLYSMLKDYAGSDDPSKLAQLTETEYANVYPTKKFKIPVDVDLVRKNGTVNADDSVVNEIDFEVSRSVLDKGQTAILNIIAANKWKRPIYFTSPYRDLGFEPYLRMDGLTYRLVPVKNSDVNRNWVMDVMMNKFKFGNADKHGVYYDEENRRHLNSIRVSYATAAINLADNERKEDAKKLLNRCDKMMLQENFPYGMVSRYQQHDQISAQFLLAAYKAGDSNLVAKVSAAVRKDLEQQIAYFNSLDEGKQGALESENESVKALLQQIQQMEQYFKAPKLAPTNGENNNPVINNLPKPKMDSQPTDKTGPQKKDTKAMIK